MKTDFRIVGALFSVVMLCFVAAFAQQKPVRAPFFQGEELPTPPQQHAPWPHGDDTLSSAAAALFDQGMADPRGLEYREIEIGVANPWDGGGYIQKTHGWVLPVGPNGGQFAVGWDGLVHPVVRVGNAADLHKDWAPEEAPAQGSGRESIAASVGVPSPVKAVMLLRLGEDETARRIAKAAYLDAKSDPYLDLASEWAWSAFERAVCAHERGDDRLALADARLLTTIRPLIEAEAKRRGSERPTVYPEYLPFLRQVPTLLADCERRLSISGKSSPGSDDIASLIADLENVNARQWGQPGGVSLASDRRVQALVKRGDAVVEPLLDVMEHDTRLTRSVSFTRSFFRGRYLIPVADAAYAALVKLLHTSFRKYNSPDDPVTNQQKAAAIRAYWAKMSKLSLPERFYMTLKDDQAGESQWLQAAANIVKPTDVEGHGGWTRVPKRKSGQRIELRGESLRDGRTPSVSALIARRSDELASIRTNSSIDHSLYLAAGQMALYLADWDRAAAIPTLKKRLSRAWEIGKEPNDILAFNGNPAEHFGSMIAKMTLARVSCGDLAAYDEYAAWIQGIELKGVFSTARDLLQPLSQGKDRPSIARVIDYLFNDSSSPWSNVFAKENGFWVSTFWESELPLSTPFSKHALRGLADDSPAGTIAFRPREEWNSHGEASLALVESLEGAGYFDGVDLGPNVPPAGEKRAFRVKDLYAYYYARYQNGPNFQLFWPKEKRDAGVQACRRWLKAKL